MDDIIGARYWYNPTKQYGYELVSFRIVKFRDGKTRQPFYIPYVNVLLEKSKLQSKGNYPSVEGYLDEEFFMERWTGMEDWNGNEIYEGDILEVKSEDPITHYWERRYIGVVRYGRDNPDTDTIYEFYLESEGNTINFSDILFSYYGEENFQVIGNVNENPEMYEKLKKGGL